jgi:hypothetical protein
MVLPEKQIQKIHGGYFERLGPLVEKCISIFEEFGEEAILYLAIFQKWCQGY